MQRRNKPTDSRVDVERLDEETGCEKMTIFIETRYKLFTASTNRHRGHQWCLRSQDDKSLQWCFISGLPFPNGNSRPTRAVSIFGRCWVAGRIGSKRTRWMLTFILKANAYTNADRKIHWSLHAVCSLSTTLLSPLTGILTTIFNLRNWLEFSRQSSLCTHLSYLSTNHIVRKIFQILSWERFLLSQSIARFHIHRSWINPFS